MSVDFKRNEWKQRVTGDLRHETLRSVSVVLKLDITSEHFVKQSVSFQRCAPEKVLAAGDYFW